MIRSMTAFASAQGNHHSLEWTWEMRSVNARGLDLRLRIPDWLDGLEAATRSDLSKSLTRGNVTLNLRVSQSDEGGQLALNVDVLNSVFEALEAIETSAQNRGVALAPARSSDILALRGVLDNASADGRDSETLAALKGSFAQLKADFIAMREQEGAALKGVLLGQLDEIARLANAAGDIAQNRKSEMDASYRDQIAKFADVAPVDPERVAQEIAVIAVKSDVTEELDRLHAHVTSARELVAKGGPVGRRLDFLCQEFNREANTLCSKSQNTDLTSVGLDLKATIDQMREQVQNIE